VIAASMKHVMRVFFLLALVWPLQSQAGIDGQYQGEYRGKKVSAVLETMSTTVTGVLSIGEDSYLLRVESGKSSLSGQLTNIKSSEALKLLIKPKGDAIDVEVTPKGADVMLFTLQKQ
jgi:hypothetical protein